MTLKLYFLGQFKLQANGQTLNLSTRSAQSLLAYLALNAGVTHRREKLASLLWPDAAESNARSYLRQALWQIRKTLESGSLDWQDYLQINNISIAFDDHSDYWLDADPFQSRLVEHSTDEIAGIASLYRGELLPGFYDDWVVVERERLLMAYHQTMNILLDQLIQAEQWEAVICWSEQWIRLGFSPEPAFRALMQAYAGQSDLEMVSISYQRCEAALDRELATRPSPETEQLYELLRKGAPQKKKPPSVMVDHGKHPPFFLQAYPRDIEQPQVVAREPEILRLNAFLDQALSSQGKVIFITGEAGSGKTALINEFTRQAHQKYPHLVIAQGNCNAYTGIGDPYLPFREILGLLSGDVEALWSAGAVTTKYAQFLWNMIPVTVQAVVDTGPDLVDAFVGGKALLERSITYAASEEEWINQLEILLQHKMMERTTPNPHQSDLFIQYSKVLQALARSAPLVLVIDDLQWADPGSISLLFHLSRNLAGFPILIIGAYRPEEIALGRSGERHPLEPVVNELRRMFGDIEINLGRADRRSFVDALLDSEPNRLGSRFRESLYQLTRSHPLFTVELLRGLQERGDLVKDANEQWMEGAALDWEMLPARVEAVIGERVDRLDPLLQAILRTASVEGEVFTAEVIARVHALPEAAIFEHLSRDLERKHQLIQAHSIQRIDGQLLSCYRFRHILVQKYLYNCLDEVERVHLHEQVGQVIEELYAHHPDPAVMAPQLARHFLEAKNTEKALYYLQKAGEKAFLVYAYQEAITHLDLGLSLLATLPEPHKFSHQELSLQLSYSLAYNLATGAIQPEMEQATIRALELCQEIGNSTQYCQLLNIFSLMNYVKGENQIAFEYAQKAVSVAQQAKDPLLIALGNWCLGVAQFSLGDFAAALQSLEQVTAFYRPEQHHLDFVTLRGVDAGLSSMAYIACCLWYLGYPDQARNRSQEVLDLAHQIGHSFSLADVLRYGCCEVYWQLHDGPSLKVYAEELLHVSQEKNMEAWISGGEYNLGIALILSGQLEEGFAFMQRGIAGEDPRHVRCSMPGVHLFLAETYANTGDLEQGKKSLHEAFAVMEQTGERRFEAELYRVQGIFQILTGEPESAEKSLFQALEIACQQKARSLELRAAVELARLWQQQGKAWQACHLVNEIYDGFREGFDTHDLQEAAALIGPSLTPTHLCGS